MQFEDGPQLPLTSRRKALLAVGLAMFTLQAVGAAVAGPATTGDNANAAAIAAIWGACVAWSTVTALLLVRQADLPDVATASFVVTIAACAAFSLSAAIAARGTKAQIDLVDGLFLGVTGGGLTSVIVWGLAMGAARVLRLPTTEGLHASG
jgi:hypothetical protein